MLRTLVSMLLVLAALPALAQADCFPERIVKQGWQNASGNSVAAYTTIAPSSSSTWGSAQASGTSGCKKNSRASRDAELEQFVAATQPALAQAMAQGHGDHLHALAALLGCPREAFPAFAAFGQREAASFAAPALAAPDLRLHLEQALRADPVLAAACGG